MTKARKGLEPGSHARVFRAGGGFGDSVGMYEVPDDGEPLVIRDLAPGSYTARDELGNEVHFVQEPGVEMAAVRTIGADRSLVGEIRREEDVSPDVRAPAAPGTAIVTEPPDDPLAGLPGAPEGTPEELMDPVQRRIAEGSPARDLRGQDLDRRMRELDIEGRSSMSADEKRRAVEDAEGEHETFDPAPQPHRDDTTEELGEKAAQDADPQPPDADTEDEKRSGVSGAGGARISPGLPEEHDEDEIAGTT